MDDVTAVQQFSRFLICEVCGSRVRIGENGYAMPPYGVRDMICACGGDVRMVCISDRELMENPDET